MAESMKSEDPCIVCGHEGDDVELIPPEILRESVPLCMFCRNTHAGNTAIYPKVHTSEMKFTATMVAGLYWELRRDLAEIISGNIPK